jgi:hypothetical protein
VCFVLLFGFSTLYPLLVVPAIVGALVGLLSEGMAEALLTGGVAGFVGGWISLSVYGAANYLALIMNMPRFMYKDLTLAALRLFLAPIVISDPVNSWAPSHGSILLPLVAAALVALAAGGVRWAAGRARDTMRLRVAVAALALTLLAVSFFVTFYESTARYRSLLDSLSAEKNYASDPIIYFQTYSYMREGQDFYRANVRAAQGDRRLAKTIVGGRSRLWGAAYPWREPWVFYLWQVIAPGGAGQVVMWGGLLATGALIFVYLALSPFVGEAALIPTILIYPGLLFQVAWLNSWHPDWWASIFVLFSMCLLMRRNWWLAGAAALAAALCREVMIVWLLLILVAAVWRWRGDERLRRLVVFLAALLVVFAITYAVHLRAASAYVDPAAASQASAGRLAQIGLLAWRSFTEKMIAPTSYLMTPYGAPFFPTWLLMPLGALGLWLGLRKDRKIAAATAGYLVFWFAWYLVLGAESSYWGQEVMIVAIVVTGSLAAKALAPGPRPLDGPAGA